MAGPVEIERKFIVSEPAEAVQEAIFCTHSVTQGYLSVTSDYVVRVRVTELLSACNELGKYRSKVGYLCVKAGITDIMRHEFEYEIPADDAEHMLTLVQDTISKTRYVILDEHKQRWDVDFFHGKHEGLVMAEIELTHPEQEVILPTWVGKEVSDNPNYYNSNM